MAHDDQQYIAVTRGGVTPVGALALRVVSVLNARQAEERQGATRPHIRSLGEKRVTARTGFDAGDLLAELRGFHLSDGQIIGMYIPACAREVGTRWVDSDMGFADVTIASARLQSLLSEVAYFNPANFAVPSDPIDVLMVTCEQDQHTLGAFVAAAQLRRRGASVDVSCGESADKIAVRILKNEYDVVMFSASRGAALESVEKIIRHLRWHMASPPRFAVGGIVLDLFTDVQRLTGADLATADLDKVVAHCGPRTDEACAPTAWARR
jgi:methylmalonyl-CoA mutase cobalamin-binding subunit